MQSEHTSKSKKESYGQMNKTLKYIAKRGAEHAQDSLPSAILHSTKAADVICKHSFRNKL